MHKLLIILSLMGLAGAAGAREDIEVLARTCNGCHGVNGVSAGASIPSIGGLPREYLRTVMKQWKYDERDAVTMGRIIKGFSDDDIDALATYFARKPWVPVRQAAPATLLAHGQKVASDNCQDCHGLKGNDPDVDAPRINGQWAKYMELELEKYRSKEYKLPHRRMTKAANQMKRPADVDGAAAHYGAQGR
jgi:sulfide dehydrogenase cytochrome subunit